MAPPTARETHVMIVSPSCCCSSLRKTSRWSSSPSTSSTFAAHSPHSPRRQSHIISTPSSLSASSSVRFLRTVDLAVVVEDPAR